MDSKIKIEISLPNVLTFESKTIGDNEIYLEKVKDYAHSLKKSIDIQRENEREELVKRSTFDNSTSDTVLFIKKHIIDYDCLTNFNLQQGSVLDVIDYIIHKAVEHDKQNVFFKSKSCDKKSLINNTLDFIKELDKVKDNRFEVLIGVNNRPCYVWKSDILFLIALNQEDVEAIEYVISNHDNFFERRFINEAYISLNKYENGTPIEETFLYKLLSIKDFGELSESNCEEVDFYNKVKDSISRINLLDL
jgi:hypothetical protein